MSSGEHVELISMWVAPDHRGTGLAGRLIGEVVARVADLPDSHVEISGRDDTTVR